MVDNHQQIKVFERETNADFVADFTRGLVRLYRSTYLETEDFPIHYQKYLRPHLLRVRAEVAFLSTAGRHNLESGISFNSSGDAHALVIDGPYVITVSRADGPNKPPRPAKFRTTYAAYCEFGQLPLPGPEFSTNRKIVAISDQSDPLYVLITHGPKEDDWREVGFIHANVVVRSIGGFNFLGTGIDLLARLQSQNASSTEQVGEPEVRLDDSEEKRAGIDG